MKSSKNFNFYRDYYHLSFTKIYWSKLASLHISRRDGEYYCDCCNKHPTECNNIESANEYKKIEQIIEKSDLWATSSINYPVYWTGYIRWDLNPEAYLISKIQRELARCAGFKLKRSGFW